MAIIFNQQTGRYESTLNSVASTVSKSELSKKKRLEQFGYDSTVKPETSTFEKLLDYLSRGESASANLIGGTLFRGQDFGSSLTKAKDALLTGQNKLTYTDLLKESGMGDNMGTNIAGFALGTLLDPLTYLSGSKIIKGVAGAPGIKQGLGALGKGGKALIKAGRSSELAKPFIEGTEGLVKYGQRLFGAQKYANTGMENLDTLLRGGVSGRQSVETVSLLEKYKPLFTRMATTSVDNRELIGRAIEKPGRYLNKLDESTKQTYDLFKTFLKETGETKKNVGVVKELIGKEFAKGNEKAVPLTLPGVPKKLISGMESIPQKSEADSYLLHSLTDEYRAKLLQENKSPDEAIQALMGLSRKNIAKTEKSRQLKNTIAYYNKISESKNGFKMFETDTQKILSKYVYNYTRNKSLLDVAGETLKLTDEAGIPLVKKLTGDKIPKGMVKLSGLPYEKGYYTSPEVAKQINRVTGVMSSSPELNKFIKAFDKSQGIWKKFVTQYSPSFYLNNLLGAEFNNFIENADSFSPKVFSAVNKMLANKGLTVKLKNGSVTGQEFLEMLKKGGAFTNQVSADNYMAKAGLGKAIDEFTGKINSSVENVVRLQAAYAEVLKTGDINKAIQKVWKIHGNYNPEAMGTFERGVVKRAIPFFNWAKTNIPFQLRNLYEKTGKYSSLARAQNQAISPEERAKLPEYLRSSPLFSSPGESTPEEKRYYSASLPIGDLNDVGPNTSETLRKMVGSRLSPAIKIPLETSLNKNLYFDKPIVDKNLPSDMQGANAPGAIKALPQFLKDLIPSYQKYDKVNEVTGKLATKEEINAMAAYLLNYLGPLNKFGTTARTITDDKTKTGLNKNDINTIFAALAGIKPNVINFKDQELSNQKAREVELQNRINYLIQRGLIPKLK